MFKKHLEVVTQTDEDGELALIPPDMHYLSTQYVVSVPLNDVHFENPWKLRLHATKLVERKLGDKVQVTSMKVKKPHMLARSKARLLNQPSMAHVYLTVEF